MRANMKSLFVIVHFLLQRLAFFAIISIAVAATALCVLCAIGYYPWLNFTAQIGAQSYVNAGMIAQIGLTIFVVLLAFFLPSNRRIMRLENSHRNFTIGMQDVAQAYHHAHAADRSDTFRLSSEFDSIRERLAYLRDHPDLATLEPSLLEVAAQMSHISRELSDVYSDDNITRAREFLRQRQQEVDRFNARLDQAKGISRELKHWLHEVELEESVAASQLDRLRDEFHELLPEMGHETTVGARNVIGLPPRAAE